MQLAFLKEFRPSGIRQQTRIASFKTQHWRQIHQQQGFGPSGWHQKTAPVFSDRCDRAIACAAIAVISEIGMTEHRKHC